MKFINRQLLVILAAIFIAAAVASSASANVSITIQKWTTNFGSLTNTTTYPEGDFDFALSVPHSGANPFDTTVIFSPDDEPSGSSFDSNIDIAKSNANDTSQYWIKVFVTKSDFSDPGSSGTTLSASTVYAATANSNYGSGSQESSTISDSSSTVPIGTVSLPLASPVTDTASLVRAASTYGISFEYDVVLSATKSAHIEAEMTTTVTAVPEPSWTILSMLVGMGPMTYVVRSFRRRKSTAK